MLGELKLIGPPVIAVGVVIASVIESLPESLRLVLDIAALGVLLAGFLVLGKLKAQAAAAEGAADAWRAERDAMTAKATRLEDDIKRLEAEKADLRIEISRLESRPTLDALETQLAQLTGLMQQTSVAVQALSNPEPTN